MEGDTIVSGSDGLFDNIFDQEIISIISESPGVDEAGKSLTSATGVTVLHLQSFWKFYDVFYSESIGGACKKTFSGC